MVFHIKSATSEIKSSTFSYASVKVNSIPIIILIERHTAYCFEIMRSYMNVKVSDFNETNTINAFVCICMRVYRRV